MINNTSNQSGQILAIVFIALGVVLFSVLSITAGAQVYFSNSFYTVNAEKATALAEAGIDKAINSLNKNPSGYSGEGTGTDGMAIGKTGEGEYSVKITPKDAATKVIEATGYIPSKANAKVKRTIKIETSRGVGTAFVYGVQVGEGGLQLGNDNQVQGSIYSNGSITVGNNNTITGDAWVAGGSQASPDQQYDCTTCTDYIFGKSVGGEARLDVAMSFQPSATNVLNKISLRLKKFGLPPNVTVRIMEDKNNSPDKTKVITYGYLDSSQVVTTDYGWIDVSFSSSPTLTKDTSYWIMVETSSDNTKYWYWQNDLDHTYNRGSPKWSANWNTGNPTWTAITGDLSFKTTMGGAVTSIVGGNGNVVMGDVHANTIENFTIQKDAYYKTIINSTVQGISHPNSDDPPPKVFPISDANILYWQQQAAGPDGSNSAPGFSGCVSILESKKYTSDVTFDNHCAVIVRSPVWITGNLTLNNTNILTLDSSYGTTSGVIVVDGQVTLGNSNQLKGTGQGSSLLMALSNYDSRATGISAIKVTNTANSGVFYANKGIIEPGNQNTYKELTAWQIKLTNNAIINYETGLSSTLFTSGPSGSYSLVKGTYQVK